MGYRQVVIRKSDKLHLKEEQLIVQKEDVETKIPLEDINFILIEDNTTLVTTKLLAELGKFGICFIVCDDKYEPSSIMYPYNYHFKQLENIEFQLQMSEDLKGQVWQEIVKAKLQNEVSVLLKTSKEEKVIAKIREYVKEVEPKDTTNREGLAAKMYFRSLFGSQFIRFYDDAINAALNYTYQIIKSSIIRTLSVYGLISYLGINHKSKVNNFNLVYDLIEPYRAIADLYVYNLQERLSYPLPFTVRKELINILNIPVMSNGKKCTLEYSIDNLVRSYVKYLVNKEGELSFPKLIE